MGRSGWERAAFGKKRTRKWGAGGEGEVSVKIGSSDFTWSGKISRRTLRENIYSREGNRLR